MVSSTLRQGSSAGTAVSSRKSASALGFWSAILTAFFAAAFVGIGIRTPVRDIPYPYVDVASFFPNDYLWQFPAGLLAPTFVVLMACIHHYAADDRKVYSLIAVSFAVTYAAVIIPDYFLQFAVVQPGVSAGETDGLSLFTQYNPRGMFVALEGLGYLLMNLAFLAAAAVFTGGRLERAIRWLFVASFALAVVSLIVLSSLGADIVTFEVFMISLNCTVLISSSVLLSILFKRLQRRGTS